jgi:hypothetical protein
MNERAFLAAFYDTYRSSLMNAKYYGARLAFYQRANTAVEIVIAIGTATGVAGWSIWGMQGFNVLWPIIAGAATLGAVTKPVLQLGQKIERYAKLFTGHQTNYLSLRNQCMLIAMEEGVTDEVKNRYNTVYSRYQELATLDEPHPSRRRLARCQAEVNEEIPANSLWWPAATKTAA